MASSVLCQSASISSATQPTITGDWTYCIWVKCNAAEYGDAVNDHAQFGWGSTGASSEGFNIAVLAASNTQLSAFVFRNGGSELPIVAVLTGSSTVWVCIAVRHTSGSASYDVSFRKENVFTWTTQTLTLTTQIVSAGSVFVGQDQFADLAHDSDVRSFFCQAVRMTDADLLTASENINSAPAGTNVHSLILLNAGTATTNTGTAGNWTVTTGTLGTASTEPTETVPGTTTGSRVGDKVVLMPNTRMLC